jgi:hypothetical protein
MYHVQQNFLWVHLRRQWWLTAQSLGYQQQQQQQQRHFGLNQNGDSHRC